MKKYIALFIILVMTVCSVEAKTKVKRMDLPKVQVTQELINALVKVESDGNSKKVGIYGELGILQIRQCVIDDVNKLIDKCPKSKPNWYLKDSLDNNKAKTICKKYLEYWGNEYQKQTGKSATNEILSKIWNGGPTFYKKHKPIFIANIKNYWNKVQNALA